MRKVYKVLLIVGAAIELDDTCEAKDLSRVRLRVFDPNEPSICATTTQYADIGHNHLGWSEQL